MPIGLQLNPKFRLPSLEFSCYQAVSVYTLDTLQFIPFHLPLYIARIKASHIILDYLRALTPKYAHNARKTKYFLQENFYKKPYTFFKDDSLF